MNTNFSIFICDEDVKFVETLQKLIEKLLPAAYVKKAYDGIDAWKLMEREKKPSIVICAFELSGINGLQILKKIRTESQIPDSYFILTLPRQDKDLIIKSIQSGVDDYLVKPLAMDQFILRIKSAAKTVTYQLEAKSIVSDRIELLEKLEKSRQAFQNMMKILQESRFSEKKEDLQEITNAAHYIATKICDDNDEIDTIKSAAELCYLNKIYLNEKYINQPVMVNGFVNNPILEEVPNFVGAIFNDLEGYERIKAILYHIYENFDGSGIPEKLQSWKIPAGSRIIRVLIDFYYFMDKNNRREEKCIDELEKGNSRIYDFRIVAYLDQYLASKNTKLKAGTKFIETPCSIADLKSGFTLSRNIITSSGLKLMASNTILDDEMIDRIKTISGSESIIGSIFVKKYS